MNLVKVYLTRLQCEVLQSLYSELVQMVEFDPENRGVMLAQVYPNRSYMKVGVLDHEAALRLKKALEGYEND